MKEKEYCVQYGYYTSFDTVVKAKNKKEATNIVKTVVGDCTIEQVYEKKELTGGFLR